MDLKSKRVLVTGAGGFVGSHLTERLVRAGASVRAFLRYNSRKDLGFIGEFPHDIQDRIEIVHGEIRELDTARHILKDIDVVFNLAALVGIPYSYLHPQEVVETNTVGTMNLLLAAKDVGVQRFVQTSTSEVYGSARSVPMDENHPLQPQSPYSASKISADALAMSFYYTFDLPVAVIRPFNMYGARQSARAIIPTIITQALVLDEIRLGRTDTTRDFTYVTDSVEAFIRMAEVPAAVGQIVNVGTGIETSVSDLVDKVAALLGKKASTQVEARRQRPTNSEVTRLCADARKAHALLGWQPKVSIDTGLAMTCEYIRTNLSMYHPLDYTI
jgi:NAD dependent epimerase/dehydratase